MTFEPALALRADALLHLRVVDEPFLLCGPRSAQGLQASDPRRRTLPKCRYCEQRKVELLDAETGERPLR